MSEESKTLAKTVDRDARSTKLLEQDTFKATKAAVAIEEQLYSKTVPIKNIGVD